MRLKIIPFFLFFFSVFITFGQHSAKKKLIGKSIKAAPDSSQISNGGFQFDFPEINNKKNTNIIINNNLSQLFVYKNNKLILFLAITI